MSEKQTVAPLAGADLANVETARQWVRDFFTPESRHKYDKLSEKLRLLQTILDAGWIESTETAKLQSLGITFGDALVQKLGMEWVMVEDEFGRDPAIRMPGTTVILFPLTMSKRVERGEKVDVTDLFAGVTVRARELARNPDCRLQLDARWARAPLACRRGTCRRELVARRFGRSYACMADDDRFARNGSP